MKQSIGCLVLAGIIVGALCIAYALAPTVTILGGWSGAGVLLWWKASRKIDIPAPPPVPEGAGNAAPQVRTIVKDETHPTRYDVVWADEGTK